MDISIPGYRLLRTLGKGGMATVFLAQQRSLERKVALKVLRKGLLDDQDFGERFMREAKIVSQLVHPNIVTVHEVGEHEGHFFLSMEYIDGHDLKLQLNKLHFIEKIRVIEDIARALHYAGEKGYVHRDIKPENIMFRSDDGSAVLTDFGIARTIETDMSMTQTGVAIGTPYYMSPEQAKGLAVDHRSDLYSLGVVFYLLLTGHVPYDADTPIAIGIKHITEPLPSLPSPLSALQPMLDALMAKSPEDRYQNGLALLNDLRQVDLERIAEHVDGVDSDETQLDLVSAVDEEPAYDPNRFTLQFDAIEEEPPSPASMWPAMVASVFVVFALALVVYISRPKVLEPVFVKVDTFLNGVVSVASNHIDHLVASVNDNVSSSSKRDDARDQSVLAESGIEEPNQQEVEPRRQPEISASAPTLTERDAGIEQNKIDKDLRAVEEVSQMPSELELLKNITSLSEKHFDDAALTNAINVEKRFSRHWRTKHNDVFLRYVSEHHALLHVYPKNVQVSSALKVIKSKYIEDILASVKKSDGKTLSVDLSEFARAFPESQSGEMDKISNEAKKIIEIKKFLQQAKILEKDKKRLVPKDDSAASYYLKVLAIDATHEDAKTRLNKIVNSTLDQAQVELRQAKTADELRKLMTLLASIDFPIDRQSSLSQLKQDASLALDRIEKINALFVQATKYKERGNLYLPSDGNAYDEYQKVLRLDPSHGGAKKGLESLIDQLSEKVWGLVGDEKFEEAKLTLQRPRALFPNSRRLSSITAMVEEVVSR